jgi:FixJ family two-component response regulator
MHSASYAIPSAIDDAASTNGDGKNNASGNTTVLIAARAGSHRATLAAFLESRGYTVKFADSQVEALNTALTGSVDMVVTGHTMPGIDGYALTRDLRAAAPELPVILLSAGGAILGQALLDCATALGVLNMGDRADVPDAVSDVLSKLTPREREVLNLVSSGHANKSVARLLSISPRTVENHRAQIMRKTNSRCVADLVRLSLAAGSAAMAAVTSAA